MSLPRILITAGPTREPLDAVRYLSNRSSGRLGVELARAGREAGLEVTLLLGPSCASPPDGVRVERFESVEDLSRLLDTHFPRCDVLVMAAAVGDFRPVNAAGDHMKSEKGESKIARHGVELRLEPTPDLLASCASRRAQGQRLIGFALEPPDQLQERAQRKLRDKDVDMIVGNPLQTMDGSHIRPAIFTADGDVRRPGEMNKADFARWLTREIIKERMSFL